MKPGPCKDCPDRRRLCWDECEKYQSWRRYYQAAMNAEYQYKKAHNDWQEVFYNPKRRQQR